MRVIGRQLEQKKYKKAPPAHPHRSIQEEKTKEVENTVEEQPEEEVVERIELASLPASSHSRWTDLEVSYIDVNPNLSHRRAYELYP